MELYGLSSIFYEYLGALSADFKTGFYAKRDPKTCQHFGRIKESSQVQKKLNSEEARN